MRTINPADFDPARGWGIYEECDREMVRRKYPLLYDELWPPTAEELEHRDRMERAVTGLPPRRSRRAAEALARLLLDHPDVLAPVIQALTERRDDGRS